MTCEIAIMNLQAIILAADSAMTVRRWINGKEEIRFFKGTNKIFQLSDQHPVGLMIFGTASLQEVPWEVVIKDFRDNLGGRCLPAVADYADTLFRFIENHTRLYPPLYRDKLFKDQVVAAGTMYLFFASNSDTVKGAKTDEEKRKAYADALGEQMRLVDKTDWSAPFGEPDLERARSKYGDEVQSELQQHLVRSKLEGIVDLHGLRDLATKSLLKNYSTFMSGTGVVVAGFGSDDYFPSFHEYECWGLLLDRFLYAQRGSEKIDIGKASSIKAFAMTDMVKTFLTGFSPDTYSRVNAAHQAAVKGFAEAIRTELQLDDLPSLEKHLAEATKQHDQAWWAVAFEAHYTPLTRVIGSLPVEEMAGLAETLIMLQSLKEKVTLPTESVGGPVDVAVITKSDGFIWIKRKHYFDAKLNPRFLARQARKLHSEPPQGD